MSSYHQSTHSGSINDRDFVARNQGYQQSYASVEAKNGQFKQRQASGKSNSRKDNMASGVHE